MNRDIFGTFFMAGQSWGGATTADDMMTRFYKDPIP